MGTENKKHTHSTLIRTGFEGLAFEDNVYNEHNEDNEDNVRYEHNEHNKNNFRYEHNESYTFFLTIKEAPARSLPFYARENLFRFIMVTGVNIKDRFKFFCEVKADGKEI